MQAPIRSRPPDDPEEPSYYDIPLLKAPVWTWEIPVYFFLGGVSTGAYVLARVAERFGGDACRDLTRVGTTTAILAFAPCPALLTLDLGDPRRFHHMLRVFKPSSPMNLGSWALTAYGGVLALAAWREWVVSVDAGVGALLAAPSARPYGEGAASSASTPTPTTDHRPLTTDLLDFAGVPVALLMAGYTGVLLSTTSTPVWSRNPWLGPLFSASALHSGASAVDLALEAANRKSPVRQPLDQIHAAGRLAEAVTLAGYLAAAGRLAEPLTRGKLAPYLWGGVVGAGLVLPGLLERGGRHCKIAASALSLLGGLALRWAVVRAGRPSANDPSAARAASRPRNEPVAQDVPSQP